MRIIFASWSKADYQGRVLTQLGAVDRLLSYWEEQKNPEGSIAIYVRDGWIGKSKQKVMVNGWDETERMPLTAVRLAEMRKKT